MRRFSGKVVIVTGVAQGMGAAVARRRVADGGNVGLVGRDAALLTGTVGELPADRVINASAERS